jgi:hypothetical protein
MILSESVIAAMVEGMRRVKRIPQKEWLEPVIQRLEQLQDGEKLTIENLR